MAPVEEKRSTRREVGEEAVPAGPPAHDPTAGPAESAATTPPPPPPRQYRRRLGNLGNVKTGLADVIRKLEAGDLNVKLSNALVYAYSVLAGVMETEKKLGELEERLAALEAEGAPTDGTFVRRRGSSLEPARRPPERSTP